MLPLTTLEKNIRENLKHNITVNLLDGGIFGMALGFASFSAVLPLFVASMTKSATLIGLVPAIVHRQPRLPLAEIQTYRPDDDHP
jgi:hypothetical protein